MKLKHVLTGIVPAVLALSTAGFAQNSSNDTMDARYKRWFQIELVIFERNYDTTANSTEIWPNTLNLSYPEKINHLFDSEEWTNSNGSASDESHLLSANQSDNAGSATSKPTQLNSEGLPLAVNTNVNGLPAMQVPFIKLPPSMHILTSEAKGINRRNAFRVLFHEAWRQPLEPTKVAGSIAIHGGDAFDKHHELEGSVLISVDRYLHIRTNLWKAKFDINYGQNTEYWPPIPLAPEKFVSKQNAGNPILSDTNGDTQNSALTAAMAGQTPVTNNGLDTSDGAIDARSLSLDLSGSDTGNGFEFGNVDLYGQNSLPSYSTYDTIETAPYIVKEIIQFKQKRRMRSNELHYLDHPRLGILIKILPYEVPLIADASATADTAAIK